MLIRRLVDYDADSFLFTFEEFKRYFKGLIRVHLVCGEDCLHLKRFYQKIGGVASLGNSKA